MTNTVVIASIAHSLSDFLANASYSKIVVITDQNTHKYCYPHIKLLLPKHTLIKIRSGENHKNLETCQQIWQRMTNLQLDRHALVLNLGGGVIGDMGGFCAATYKRGIDFVQIPTTLLSQVDASVGGKLGIDFASLKNHIGVFELPKTVLIDSIFLKTLPKTELRSGFAEIVKHCLIADANKWAEIRVQEFDGMNWDDLISHSVAIKSKVVANDPTEKGLRKILNFGHTIGHAVETFCLNKPRKHLLHGEAIAVGMIAEAYLSFRKKMIDEQTLTEIEEFIFSVFGRANISDDDISAILELTLQDKKNRNGKVQMALLTTAGACSFDIPVSKTEMQHAILYYLGK